MRSSRSSDRAQRPIDGSIHRTSEERASLTSPPSMRRQALELARDVLEGQEKKFTTDKFQMMRQFHEHNGLDVYLFQLTQGAPSTVVMYFEGSSLSLPLCLPCQDWIYDCQFCKSPIGGGEKVHSGFHAQLAPHQQDLKTVLLNFFRETGLPIRSQPPVVVLVGHSLGGAIASLFARYLRNKEKNLKVKLITIGSPKVGDAKWRSVMIPSGKLEIYRITNGCDPVPCLPPMCNYVHIGTHIHLKNGKCCMLSNCGICCADHCVCSYISAINQEIER